MTCLKGRIKAKCQSVSRIRTQRPQLRTGPQSVVIQETFDLTNGGDGNVLIPQVSLGASLNVGDGDRVDGTFDLSGSESLSGGHHLSTDL